MIHNRFISMALYESNKNLLNDCANLLNVDRKVIEKGTDLFIS
jgi:hypothetical protein